MNNVHLVVKGRLYPVHHQHLLAIAADLPEDGVYSRKLAKELVALGVKSITMSLIHSPSLSLLDRRDVDRLWKEGDPDIRRSLVAEPDFVKRLTTAQAKDIIRADDPDMLESIAEMAHLLYAGQGRDQGLRLYYDVANALLEHIAGSPYPRVRLALAQNRYAPLRYRPAFRTCVESGLCLTDAEETLSTIQPEDIELLNTESMETLCDIALRVEDIEDEAAQRGVIDLLCAHPDPCVRLALAKNSDAPRPAMERLLEDEEPDVRQAARATLRDMDRYSVNDQGDG